MHLDRLILTLYVLNKALGISTIMWGAWNVALILGGHSMLTMTYIWDKAGLFIMSTNGAMEMSFQQLGAAIAGAFAGLIIGYYAGRWIADKVPAWIPIIIGLAVAFAFLWSAVTIGAAGEIIVLSWVKITAAAIALGVAIGGMSAWAMPAQGEVDMSGYEAQLEGNFALGDTSTSSSPETLYVRKLVYTDSNQSEYMQVQSSTQAGA